MVLLFQDSLLLFRIGFNVSDGECSNCVVSESQPHILFLFPKLCAYFFLLMILEKSRITINNTTTSQFYLCYYGCFEKAWTYGVFFNQDQPSLSI